METNRRHGVNARIFQRRLALVGLVVAALCFAGPNRAQSSAAPAPVPAAPGTTQQLSGLAPPASISIPRPASATGPATSAEAKKGPKGKSERVKVNGYWKIEVHDPAGKLVSHTEFENSLTTSDPNGFSGDFALAEILGGSRTHATFFDSATSSGVDIISSGYATGSIQGFLNNLGQLEGPGVVGGRGGGTGDLQFVAVQFELPFLSVGLNTAPLLSEGLVTSLGSGPCVVGNVVNGVSPPPSGCLVPTSQALNTSGGTGSASSTMGNQIVLMSSFVAQASATVSQVGTYFTPIRLIYSASAGGSIEADSLTFPAINTPVPFSLTSATLSTA